MSTLIADIRYSFRSLLKNPGLTLAAILSLGLGIGANTTIFTWVQAVLFRPIPLAADPSSIRIAAMQNREGQTRSWSYPNFVDFRDRTKMLDIVGQDDQTFNIAVDDTAERAWGAVVSGNYFEVMGIRPAAGRFFTAKDVVTPGGHPVAVLSYANWQRRFAGDPAVIGKQVTINNTPITIIGVAPEGFIGSFLGVSSAAWVPMAMQKEMMGGDRMNQRGNGWFQSIVRLKPGVSAEQAQAEASSIMAQLEQEYPDFNEGRRLRIVQTWEAPFGAGTVLAPLLGVLSVLVALVLVIACANVANLLLSKAVSRRREVAVRLSLGASRTRLIRQLLTESFLLAIVAGITGVVMAYWTMDVIMAFVPPVDMPIDLGLRMDTTTLLFALGVSMVTGLVFGLAPALQASSNQTINALKEEGRSGSGGRTTGRLRNALVVAQVAVCLVLLVGATLFLRSFIAAQSLSPGFDASHVVTASMDMFPSGYTGDRHREFQRRAIEAVQAVPGVQSAAFGSRLPLGFGGNNSTSVGVEGYVPRENEEIVINYSTIGPNYFETMGIPIRQGREYNDTDTLQSPRTLVINETMAKRYWPEGKALGGKIRLGQNLAEVIGIVADSKYSSINERPLAQLFFPMSRSETSTLRLFVKTAGDPAPLVAEVRNAIRGIDATLPVYDARTLNEHMQIAVFAQRMAANLLGAMGVLALLLAAIGLYGVMAYAVSQRTQELGIRLALGASPGSLLGMIVGQGMKLTVIGLAIGLAIALGAFGSIGAVRSLLPGISPMDPITFVTVPIVLGSIALLASWIPGRRAGKVDPLVALRYE
ncbi:MAG TPA: ABC transporter permease [Vicinamibacterales bacterium]|nr:ABC transporter permease [Vicinamibacterales bacterium]